MGRPRHRSIIPDPWLQGSFASGRAAAALAAARARASTRFAHGSAWFRLVLLGLLLSIVGTVALAFFLNLRPLPAMRIGEVAIVAGMAIGLLTVKIARERILWDWLLSGLFLIGAGHVLELDQHLGRPSSLALFALFMLASATARSWIGLTARTRAAGMWMCASGCVSVFAMLLAAWSAIADARMLLAVAIALDILFQGIAIAAFGVETKAAR